MADWVLNFDVAEHIPPEFEEAFLGNLCSLARKGVVLGWHGPWLTGGDGHVNSRDVESVRWLMRERGFEPDEPASRRPSLLASTRWSR